MAAAPLAWLHGFHLRALHLDVGASVPTHRRFEEEVLLMHKGVLARRVGRTGTSIFVLAIRLPYAPRSATPLRECRRVARWSVTWCAVVIDLPHPFSNDLFRSRYFQNRNRPVE
jgi:hypothetical protein